MEIALEIRLCCCKLLRCRILLLILEIRRHAINLNLSFSLARSLFSLRLSLFVEITGGAVQMPFHGVEFSNNLRYTHLSGTTVYVCLPPSVVSSPRVFSVALQA